MIKEIKSEEEEMFVKVPTKMTSDDKKRRMTWYSSKVARKSDQSPKSVQGLHLKAPGKYLLLSDKAMYETFQVKLLGFNKLNEKWSYENNILYHNSKPLTFRALTECEDNDCYPIVNTVNECDGTSSGLYIVTANCLEYGDCLHFLLTIENGKSTLVDYRNKCKFQIYELK